VLTLLEVEAVVPDPWIGLGVRGRERIAHRRTMVESF
jgi:hypothetical protein